MKELLELFIKNDHFPDIIGELYIFGSCLKTTKPIDIDLLFIIEKPSNGGENSYDLMKPFISSVENKFSLPVDLTILTREEHNRHEFVQLVGAIKLDIPRIWV